MYGTLGGLRISAVLKWVWCRSKNAYIILRELHQQEKDREVALATENIIDILIKTEEEISLENYKEQAEEMWL
jgi:hypothetical protein